MSGHLWSFVLRFVFSVRRCPSAHRRTRHRLLNAGGPGRQAVPALAIALLLTLIPHTRAHAQASTYVMVITGLSGEPGFVESFHQAGAAIVDAAQGRYGVPAENVFYLAEDPTQDAKRMTGKSSRETIDRTVQGIAGRAQPGDQVMVVLIGHGSFEGEVARFNLPGPDLTSMDWARLLELLRAQRVAFVNAASASGAFVNALAGKGRVVIAATRSGAEQNETMFAKYFSAALTGGSADIDKDGRVSMLEAFDYARREVAREYTQQNRILTEHALLSDDGTTVAVADAPIPAGTALLSRTFSLGSATPAALVNAAAANPAVKSLLAERRALEAKIDVLRSAKTSMDSTKYSTQLEALLLDLARKNQQIRALAGSAQ